MQQGRGPDTSEQQEGRLVNTSVMHRGERGCLRSPLLPFCKRAMSYMRVLTGSQKSTQLQDSENHEAKREKREKKKVRN